MLDLTRSFSRWLVAVAAVAACTGFNMVFQPLVADMAPFLPYLLGVSFVAFHAGRRPALLSLALSGLAVSYLWLEPTHTIVVHPAAQQLALAGFLVVSAVMIHLSALAREAIDESRQLAAALIASEKRLRGAVDMGQLGVYEWNVEGNRVTGDARYMGLWGLRPDDEMTVQRHEDAIHPDDRAGRDLARARSMDPHGDNVFQAQFRVRGYDSVERWVSVRGQVLFRNGKPVRYVGVARDISKERNAAEELRASERRSRLLAELTEATRMLADPREICLAAMSALREHLGADRCSWAEVDPDQAHFEIMGVSCAPGVPTVAGRYPIAAFGGSALYNVRAGKTCVLGDIEARIDEDPALRTYLDMGIRAVIAVPLLKDGRVVGGASVHMTAPRRWTRTEVDAVALVTERLWESIERARTTRVLRAAEERFRVAQETSPVGFVILEAVRDAHGAIQDFVWEYANPASFALMRRTADDLGGRTLLDAFPAQAGPDGLFAAYAGVVQTGIPHSTEVRVDLDGEEAWFLNASSRLGDGVAVWFMDVTERRKATEAIARQREELQTMLHLLPVGVAVSHDADGRSITVSRRLAQMLGVPEGVNPSAIHADLPEAPYRFVRDGAPLLIDQLPMQRALVTAREVHDVELEIDTADGRHHHVLSSAAPLFDGDGAVRGAIVAHVDITALKRVQRELESADRQKNEFLATLAHELRNPMAPIRYAAALLRPNLPAQTLEQVRDMLERQSAHMARLLDDLLDLSRITRNVIQLARETLDFRRVVRETVETARPDIDAAKHRLVTSLPPEPLWVSGDPTRLAQVVGNLLGNAIKYTPSGGRIEVTVERQGEAALVQVRDSGVGLSAEMMPRVFQLFAQLHSELAVSKGGLGIGLAVVKRLVDLHGGSVAAHSEGLGKGACFSVLLPLVAAPSSAVEPESGQVVPLFGERPRLLVVDDNVDAADTLATVLRAQGFPVRVAYRGHDALAMAAESRPDVVLLDLGLPDISGHDVAMRLRETYGHTLRIFAVTGWGQDDDRRRTREAGFDRHFVKPVDADALLAEIGASGTPPVRAARP